jgi:tRNA/rRNA methyltransferase
LERSKRVVLCRPAGPRNVGMVLRACDNFGPCGLYLVAPERPALLEHPEFEQAAHGVARIEEKLRIVGRLEEALAECTHAVGFTARARDDRVRASWTELQPALAARIAEPGERVALVFGSEVNGLTAAETDRCQELCHLATSTARRSINLAVCVGIVLHAFLEPAGPRGERGGQPLTGTKREFLKAHLKHVFATRVARSAFAAGEIAASIERVFSRAPLETRDARAWHMMCRALGDDRTPADFGLDPNPSERGADRGEPPG